MFDNPACESQIQKLQNYLDSMNVGTWEWNVQTGEVVFNERWAEIIGYSLADLAPVSIETWQSQAHPDDLERSDQALQDHFAGQTDDYDMDVRIRHRSGEWIWVHDRGKVMTWTADGQPLWMYGTHTDITARVELEQRLASLLSDERNNRMQISEALKDQTDLANLLFSQPLAGVFVMMLEEPVEWHDGIDKERLLDEIFAKQRIVRVNQAMLDQYRATVTDFIGTTPAQFFAHDLAYGREVWREMLDHGHLHYETRELRFDGSEMDVSGDYICMYDAQGRFTGHFGIQTDVTEQKQMERMARQYEKNLDETAEKYRLITQTIHDVVFMFNLMTLQFTFMSHSVEQLLGYGVTEAMNLTFDQLCKTDALQQLAQIRNRLLEIFHRDSETTEPITFEIQLLHKEGHLVWTEVSATFRRDALHSAEVVGAVRDISERKHREEQLLYAAMHDPLTGLLNRSAVQAMSKAQVQGLEDLPALSALLVNVDKFRLVNDALGHSGGDQVIFELARTIETCTGSQNQVFRYGGDEFLVLTRYSDVDQVQKLARSIQAAVDRQFKYNQQNVQITVSIGISLDDPELNLDQTIAQAELALYAAKQQGNTVMRYRDTLVKAKNRAELLETDLSKALGQNELELYFQPIFDIQRNRFTHAEALMRWNHPRLGLVSPGEFIPLAERTRLIIPMTDWAIRQTCQKLAAWRVSGRQDLAVSVNLSAITLEYHGHELVRLVMEALEQYQVSPASLILEITETALVRDVREITSLFGELRKKGVRLALDDFGTGYATFGALKDLPVDLVKIDRSLIREIEHNDREQMILDSLFTIVHGLGLAVVVEGVETRGQFDWLCRQSVDYVQGFLFSRPLPEQAFLEFLGAPLVHVVPQATCLVADYPVIQLVWHPEWSCGDPEIDRQHKNLILRMNRVIHFVNEGILVKDELVRLVDHLALEIELHFAYEEQILGQVGYADFAGHQRLHQNILAQLQGLRTAYVEGQSTPDELFRYLVEDVILKHTIEEDRAFIPALAKACAAPGGQTAAPPQPRSRS